MGGPPPPYHRAGSGPPDNGPRGDRRGGGRSGGGGGGGPEGPPGVSLLVRNIAPDITTSDLQNAFGRIGVIRDVYVPRDFHSQQPRGFAFIEYATPEMAREAKHEMNRFVIKGHEIEVVFAQERRKTPGEMRGRSVEPPETESRAAPSSRSGDRGGGGGGGGGRSGSSGFERYVCSCCELLS
jgi:FUS-interacting serine-arginine-rich protein 1